jgi:hypothetical protein
MGEKNTKKERRLELKKGEMEGKDTTKEREEGKELCLKKKDYHFRSYS